MNMPFFNLTPRSLSLIAIAGLLALTSCKDEVEVTVSSYTADEYALLSQKLNLPEQTFEYNSFAAVVIDPIDSRVRANHHLPTLGRVLFYDNKLSANGKVSCASCHHQHLAFSDSVALSTGFNGELTLRNSIPLASGGDGYFASNMLFWDHRVFSVAEQSRRTLQDPIEMGMDLNQLPEKLAADPIYPVLFRRAFGDKVISSERVLEAISSFVNSLSTKQTAFDAALVERGGNIFDSQNPVNLTRLTSQENKGLDLFIKNCASCHSGGLNIFVNNTQQFFNSGSNNGLAEAYTDQGIGAITKEPHMQGTFKVPQLRNVALTAPYMHDGSLPTLEAVIDHYSSGIQMHPNLGEALRDPSDRSKPKRMNFSAEEKAALLAFLNTLTDNQFVKEVKFSNPFK